MRTPSAAAQTPADCSELHQQPVDAVLHPTFVLKLCYKLPTFLLRVLGALVIKRYTNLCFTYLLWFVSPNDTARAHFSKLFVCHG